MVIALRPVELVQVTWGQVVTWARCGTATDFVDGVGTAARFSGPAGGEDGTTQTGRDDRVQARPPAGTVSPSGPVGLCLL